MKIGYDTSIYGIFSAANRKTPSTASDKIFLPAAREATTLPEVSDHQLISEFHARMASQSLDWADSDKDGRVTKDEYMNGQKRLAAANNMPDDSAANEKRWAMIDLAGKGWVDGTDLRDALAKMLPVSVGHFDQGFAERLRNPLAKLANKI